MFTKDEKEALLSKVNDIHKMLTGNGRPEDGLLYKNQKNTEFRLFWEKFGWIILTACAGVPTAVFVGLFIKTHGG